MFKMAAAGLRWFFNLLYGSTPAAFPSAYSVEESIQRLRSVTHEHRSLGRGQTSAVGDIGPSGVVLHRQVPLVGNSFAPYFAGTFERRGDATRLTGGFRFSAPTMFLMTLWFACAAFFTGLTLFGRFATHHVVPVSGLGSPASRPSLLIGPGVFLAGLAMLLMARRAWRRDIVWLTSLIGGALSNPLVEPTTEPRS